MNPEQNPLVTTTNNPAADLEFNFQSLNLSHKEEVQIDFDDQSHDQISTPYNLLFKVGPPEGPVTRSVTLQMFEKAMRSAWGRRFYKVTQIIPNLFMAHFREEDDLRWIWQRQPWIAERETMLVEWIDPTGQRPMESYTFRYLPVTVHLYGIHKTLRFVDLVDKIIKKIGEKDKSVVLSESSMFRAQEYVLARVILDVTKPLLDSVTISLSADRKIKVYVHYEKLVKICNFCGHLFHNASSCLKKQQIIWKLSPSEAAKVPDDVYGKWRSQEQEIPLECREEQESKSHNAYIQSFKDFFQKSASFSSPSSSSHLGFGSPSSQPGNMQLALVLSSQSSSSNATGHSPMDIYRHVPEEDGGKFPQEGRRENDQQINASSFQPLKSVVSEGTQVQQSLTGVFPTQMVGVLNSQIQQFQVHNPQWHIQAPSSQSNKLQQQLNSFTFQGTSQHTSQSFNNQSNS